MLQQKLFEVALANPDSWKCYIETLPNSKRPPAEVRDLSRPAFVGMLINFINHSAADGIIGIHELRSDIALRKGEVKKEERTPEMPMPKPKKKPEPEDIVPEVTPDDILEILNLDTPDNEGIDVGKVEPGEKKEVVIGDEVIAPAPGGLTKEQVIALVKPLIVMETKRAVEEANPPQRISLVYEDFEVKTEGIIPQWLPTAAKYAKLRLPQYWYGPTGAGKTHMAAVLAKLMRLEFYVLSCSPGTPEEAFTAYLLPVGENGKWGNVMGTFAKAFSEGGLCLLDELDRAERTVLMVIQTALANGYLYLPQLLGDKRLEQHKDFVFVGAGNTAGHGADRKYTAAEQLDWASKDRWRCQTIEVDYDENVEKKLCEGMNAPEVAVIGHTLRARCRYEIDKINGKRTPRQGWDRDVSTRNILNWAKQVGSKLFTVEEALYGFFVDWTDKELGMINVVRHKREGKETGRIIVS